MGFSKIWLFFVQTFWQHCYCRLDTANIEDTGTALFSNFSDFFKDFFFLSTTSTFAPIYSIDFVTEMTFYARQSTESGDFSQKIEGDRDQVYLKEDFQSDFFLFLYFFSNFKESRSYYCEGCDEMNK